MAETVVNWNAVADAVKGQVVRTVSIRERVDDDGPYVDVELKMADGLTLTVRGVASVSRQKVATGG